METQPVQFRHVMYRHQKARYTPEPQHSNLV
jgi:hypothetical protein